MLVLPSHSEGLPRVVAEAMVAGRPVIATRCGAEELVVHGETGFLVTVGDIRGIARSIAILLEDQELARKMGLKGRQRIVESFSLERYVKRIEEIISAHAT
jgi:glycosyltransferase involved in cell wall biosynthesis